MAIERTKSALKQEADSRECGDKGDVCWHSCPLCLMVLSRCYSTCAGCIWCAFSCLIELFKWQTPKMKPLKMDASFSVHTAKQKNIYDLQNCKKKALISRKKNCSAICFVYRDAQISSFSVRKCNFDVVPTTTRCRWRSLVLQATWLKALSFS